MLHLIAIVSVLFIWLSDSPDEKCTMQYVEPKIQLLLKSGEIARDTLSAEQLSEFKVMVVDPDGDQQYEVRKFRVLLNGQPAISFEGDEAVIDVKDAELCVVRIDEVVQISSDGMKSSDIEVGSYVYVVER